MPFDVLAKRISPKLKGIARKIHGAAPSFLEEDLYQEAVLRLWLNYNDGKLADKTDSYILQGCYFYLKNYVRTFLDKASLTSLNAAFNENGTEWQDILPAAETPSAEEEPDFDAIMEKIFRNELTWKEKEVVFFYLQGWTTRAIGERLGISHVSVVKLEDKIKEKCKKLRNSD